MPTIRVERSADPKAVLGYVCPECKAWSQVDRWKESEVGCDDCGSHPARRCPECDEDIDEVGYEFQDADDLLKVATGAAATDVDPLRSSMRIARLVELAEQSHDGNREDAHIEADDILCGLLTDLGYGGVVSAYHSVEKWWA